MSCKFHNSSIIVQWLVKFLSYCGKKNAIGFQGGLFLGLELGGARNWKSIKSSEVLELEVASGKQSAAVWIWGCAVFPIL